MYISRGIGVSEDPHDGLRVIQPTRRHTIMSVALNNNKIRTYTQMDNIDLITITRQRQYINTHNYDGGLVVNV